MKILSLLGVFCAFMFTNCQKSNSPIEEADARIIKASPFENSQFKIERASISLPEATTKIHFFDELNGICLTGGNYSAFEVKNAHKAGGSIYATNDGGKTWTPSYTFSKASTECLRPLGFEVMNDNTIVAFASRSMCHSDDPDVRTNLLIRSVDKGKSWTINRAMNATLKVMTRSEDNTIYALGSRANTHDNTIFDSKDGGLSWNTTVNKFGLMTKIMNLSPNKLLISGGYHLDYNPQLISSNSGVNWEEQASLEYVMSASHNEKMGLYLSEDKRKRVFNVHATHNGGDSWAKVHTFTSTTNEVKVLSATTALILGRSDGERNAGFSYTLDGGKTWKDKILPDNGNAGELVASSFYSPRSGYIVGANSILYKMTFKE